MNNVFVLFIKLSVFHFNYGSNFIFVFLFVTIPYVKQNKILNKVNFESVNKCILFFYYFSVMQCCGTCSGYFGLNNYTWFFKKRATKTCQSLSPIGNLMPLLT